MTNKKGEGGRASKGERKGIKIVRPKGPPPSPIVKIRNNNDIKIREGRGFSIGELKESGLDESLAKRFGLRIDLRRRSVIIDNVDALKKWLKPKVSRKRAVRRKVKSGKSENQAQT